MGNAKERSWTARIATSFHIKMEGPDVSVASLSGGNQQDVLLARVLQDQPRVLILHEPTQGVDEPTRRALIEVIRTAAQAGTAVLCISCDIDEVAPGQPTAFSCSERVDASTRPPVDEHADEIYAASYLTSMTAS